MSGSSTTPFAAKHFHNMYSENPSLAPYCLKYKVQIPVLNYREHCFSDFAFGSSTLLSVIFIPSCFTTCHFHICHRHFPLPRKPSRPIQIHLLGLSIDVTLFNKPYLFSNLMLGIPTLQSHGIVCLSQI